MTEHTGESGWLHECARGKRWVPLGARCPICGRLFGEREEKDDDD